MNLSKHILYAMIYIAIMAIGMAAMYTGFGIAYSAKDMFKVILWVEIILSGLVVFYVRRHASWKDVGFGTIRWVHMLWIAPSLLLVLASTVLMLVWIVSASPPTPEVLGVLAVGVMTLLVGFSEETMFRGILLRGELARRNVFAAMIASAIGFSLLHSINVLGGAPAGAVAVQLVDTFLYGLFMAPLALLIGNLMPLILLHFLWDFVLLSAGQITSTQPLSAIFALTQVLANPVQWVMTMAAWAAVFVLWRKGAFRHDQSDPADSGAHQPTVELPAE